ncbi:DUF3710 domain-containing protein [Arthrobacter sp. MSA 4-2]|uniref:DUF3710 domain-containing protein n=1 Tax=Arthrobacter sp. MSA 4-2 TaxID=2794349 RepID=UPI0018E877E8|nr:DUF3710 domain-containing protein [Arthrobacter sp. MSA 4-2]MBJ2122198.1 DUF3710 domain-containing protein [Arthrobacter sp. MSA 4-2]
MVFGRLKKKKQDDGSAEPQGTDAADTGGTEAEAAETQEPAEATPEAQRRELGPFDSAEKDSTEGYIDLGALKIGAAEGLQLRLEVEERTKRVIAVTLDLGGSTLQLQAFAAPRSEGVWDEIRQQIGLSVGSQGGTVQERQGTFGTELIAQLPAPLPDGTSGVRVARFVGVDGPRWFLRGVFGGPAALNAAAAAPVEALFRNVVVVRGDHPLPPRELLPLRLPKDASPTPNPATPARPGLTAPQRGPEITEIG